MKVLILALLATSFIGCGDNTENQISSGFFGGTPPPGFTPFPTPTPWNTPWNTPTPGFTPTPTAGVTPTPNGNGSCYNQPGVNNGNAITEYYSTNVIGNGKGNLVPGEGNETDPSWSSTYLTNQSTLDTNQLFKVRVIARPAPGKGNQPNGVVCQFDDEYSSLQLKVGVRHPSNPPGVYTSTVTFTNLALNTCPTGQNFLVPAGLAANQYLVFDVYDVMWDRCGNGWNPPNQSNPCPYNRVWHRNCFEIIVQWATDFTTEFP